MTYISAFRRFTASFVALAIFTLGLQSSLVQAAMVSTESMIVTEQAHYDREKLLEAVSQDQAKQTLINLGVNPLDVEKRIQNMTTEELAQFNQQIDELPAGGSSVIGVIVFILLLLIVLDLLGATDVFPAIRPIKVN